jgi:hypothetical protein
LILAAALTPFWGGPAGARPVLFIEGLPDDRERGRGVGKTTLAEILARLAGGHFDFEHSDDVARMKSRLLTPAALTKRVALLDNVKALRFSWAELEKLVTIDVISGHRLFHGEATRPNLLTWFVTLNGANLSKDLAHRAVVIRVKRPDPYVDGWKKATLAYVEQHRAAIVGDMVALLHDPPPLPGPASRWGPWEAGVLACVSDPAACLTELAARRAAVDADQDVADMVREQFITELRRRRHDPERDVVFIPSAAAAQFVNEATEEKRPRAQACAYLGTLAIPELRGGNAKGGHRGWRCTGTASSPGAHAVPLADLGAQAAAALDARRAGTNGARHSGTNGHPGTNGHGAAPGQPLLS